MVNVFHTNVYNQSLTVEARYAYSANNITDLWLIFWVSRILHCRFLPNVCNRLLVRSFTTGYIPLNVCNYLLVHCFTTSYILLFICTGKQVCI